MVSRFQSVTSATKGIPAHKLRTDSLLIEELEWFFTQAESDIGLHSNFGPLMDRAQSGSSGGSDHSVESQMEAAHAEGIIRRHLHAMPSHHAGVLLAAFEPRRWPAKLGKELGRLTGIAVRLTMASVGLAKDIENRREREEATARWLNQAVVREGALALTVVRSQAQSLFATALRSYAKQRGTGSSLVPGR
jgi:hypothetical protein